MFIIRLTRYLLGYVRISVRGRFVERFLNIASRRGISFWKVRKTADGAEMFVSKPHFRKLRPIARAARCQIRIVRKYGFPFRVYRHRKRTGFFIGAVSFFMILWYLTSFIWSIEIVNGSFTNQTAVLQSLAEWGLKKGAYAGTVDIDSIKNRVLMRHQDIAWIGINIKGSKAVVELQEKIPVPEVVDKDVPCNIVAGHTAQIVSMEVLDGSAQVREGEAVKEGQLLVSGLVNSAAQGVRYIHAQARVMGRTWYDFSAEVPLYEVIKSYSGQEKRKTVAEILNWRINLFIGSSIPYEKYDKITREKELSIGENIVLPAKIITDIYREYTPGTREIKPDTAMESGLAECERQLERASPGCEVVKRDTRYIVDGSVMRVEVKYECIEDIAKTEIILR